MSKIRYAVRSVSLRKQILYEFEFVKSFLYEFKFSIMNIISVSVYSFSI